MKNKISPTAPIFSITCNDMWSVFYFKSFFLYLKFLGEGGANDIIRPRAHNTIATPLVRWCRYFLTLPKTFRIPQVEDSLQLSSHVQREKSSPAHAATRRATRRRAVGVQRVSVHLARTAAPLTPHLQVCLHVLAAIPRRGQGTIRHRGLPRGVLSRRVCATAATPRRPWDSAVAEVHLRRTGPASLFVLNLDPIERGGRALRNQRVRIRDPLLLDRNYGKLGYSLRPLEIVSFCWLFWFICMCVVQLRAAVALAEPPLRRLISSPHEKH